MGDEVPVVIVGAGPSGLSLGLVLAKYEIRSVILEKEREITQDPRAIYLNGDVIRILYDLGLHNFDEFGQTPGNMSFHEASIKNDPFLTVDLSTDVLNQCLPTGITHAQPKLEAAMERHVNASEFCELRRDCTVERHEVHGDSMTIWYKDGSGTNTSIKCSWLVGADGKRGVVRKHFLEPTGIVQQGGLYEYEGTWVAANLQISLPTPETHPNLPFWGLGWDSNRIFDFFWPKNFHFIKPPGKPVACGRFGPLENRLWRHEFAELDWNESMDTVELLWENITPMLTRYKDEAGVPFADGPVLFPRDCINILRCRPFEFSHRVVNRWFDGRRILIGDAAHVFPPFGGEGMSSGIRDANQLAWRLATIEKTPDIQKSGIERLLHSWASERRRGIDNAAIMTMINGKLCNEPKAEIPDVLKLPTGQDFRTNADVDGFKGTQDGLFLPEFGGGGRIAQTYVEDDKRKIIYSDEMLRHKSSALTLVVIGNKKQREDEAREVLRNASLPTSVLSPESLVVLNSDRGEERSDTGASTFLCATPNESSGLKIPRGYDEKAILSRLGDSNSYALVRPDFYIYALLKDSSELRQALATLKTVIGSKSLEVESKI